MKNNMSREEWLRCAVEELESELFCGDLDIMNHDYQISCCKCGGKRKSECFQPSQNEDIGLDDFFPTTIHVSFDIRDPEVLLTQLAYECVHAFFGIEKCNKLFKETAKKYGFEEPLTEATPSMYLKDIINNIHKKLIKRCGDWPGIPVKLASKDSKEKTVRSYTLFCPECGYELKVNKKLFTEHGEGLPTCPCGTKMAVDNTNEIKEATENQN